jgi:hypothetical protein
MPNLVNLIRSTSGNGLGIYQSTIFQPWIRSALRRNLNGKNLYVYAAGNPVNRVDPSGLIDPPPSVGQALNDADVPTPDDLGLPNPIDVDVYVFPMQDLGLSAVGHVMITPAGQAQTILSQFPHPPGQGRGLWGPNTKYNYADTLTTEGVPPDYIFRVRVPNAAGFFSQVGCERSKPLWDWDPNCDQTHCTRAAYNALQSGGVPLTGVRSGQKLPFRLADELLDLGYPTIPYGTANPLQQYQAAWAAAAAAAQGQYASQPGGFPGGR